MAQKPENQFISSIHKHFPHNAIEGFTRFHTGGLATGGVADMWYDGPATDVWVEYKFIRILPTTLCLTDPKTKPFLTALQEDWGLTRLNNHRNYWLCLGCKDGGFFIPSYEWSSFIHPRKKNLFTRKEIAHIIYRFVCGVEPV